MQLRIRPPSSPAAPRAWAPRPRAGLRRGAKVAVCDLNAKLRESVAAEIGGAAAVGVGPTRLGGSVIVAAATAHGPARVLMNFAGIGVAKPTIGREGPMPLEDFETVIRVNLVGAFNMLRLAPRKCRSWSRSPTGERGGVISTASVAAYDGQIGQSAYSASKAPSLR